MLPVCFGPSEAERRGIFKISGSRFFLRHSRMKPPPANMARGGFGVLETDREARFLHADAFLKPAVFYFPSP